MIRQSFIIGLVTAAFVSTAAGNIVFVDSNAHGNDDGSTWTDALNNLQDALDAAQPGFQIWVANGAYVPDRDREGTASSGPQATFVLKYPGVTILGGFLGGEQDPGERDPLLHPTVIEGEGQKWHLVFVDDKFGVDTSTRFDGFVLHGGNAVGPRREDSFGGGMLVVTAGVTLANCTFANNLAKFGGGGLYHEGPSMNLVNCRFIDNAGGDNASGGGLLAIGPVQIANCLFVGNRLGEGGHGGGAALLCNAGSTCLQASANVWSSTFYGNQVSGATGSGGGLFAMSHVQMVNSVVWGNTAPQQRGIGYALVPPGVTFTDVDDPFGGAENISLDPQFVSAGGRNFHLTPTSPCVNTGNIEALPTDFGDLDGDDDPNEPLPYDLDLTPRETTGISRGCFQSFDCNENSVADYTEIARCAGDPACGDCNGNGILDGCDASIARLFVNPQATGIPTGESWQNAYPRLDQAMCVANKVGSSVAEIWVRHGAYVPALDVKGPNRDATFALRNGLSIFGGFAGTESDVSQRTITANPTVLSGDLFGDDGPGFANIDENSYHVVTAQNVDASAVLDGFIVSGGNANPTGSGALVGAGLLVISSSPTIRNCSFVHNFAAAAGGGIALLGSSMVQMNNCRFAGNAAPVGTAVAALVGGHATIANSILRENGPVGGGATVAAASDSAVELESCTVTQNAGPAGIASFGGVLTIRNSILWHDAQPELSAPSGSLTVTYSDVQGGFAGAGTIDADPLFVSPNGPDGVPGTSDDNLRLRAGSPCLDAGDPVLSPTDLTSVDADGAPRVQQCRHDLGAYESPLFADCDADGVSDACEIAANSLTDANSDRILDRCQAGFADCNGNGVNDSAEIDSDGDGVIDACDNCPTVANGDQRDSNGNGHGDACDSMLHFVGCPGDIQVASSDPAGTTVSFTLPQAVDGVGTVHLTSTRQPGDFFQVGTTQVTITATDTAGAVATCSFHVIVVGPEEPNRPSPDPNQTDCPALYRVQGGALRFFGIPFGCGPGCLVAAPLTIIGILGMKRRRR